MIVLSKWSISYPELLAEVDSAVSWAFSYRCVYSSREWEKSECGCGGDIRQFLMLRVELRFLSHLRPDDFIKYWFLGNHHPSTHTLFNHTASCWVQVWCGMADRILKPCAQKGGKSLKGTVFKYTHKTHV